MIESAIKEAGTRYAYRCAECGMNTPAGELFIETGIIGCQIVLHGDCAERYARRLMDFGAQVRDMRLNALANRTTT